MYRVALAASSNGQRKANGLPPGAPGNGLPVQPGAIQIEVALHGGVGARRPLGASLMLHRFTTFCGLPFQEGDGVLDGALVQEVEALGRGVGVVGRQDDLLAG